MDMKRRVREQFQRTAEGYLHSAVHAKGEDLKWISDLVSQTPRAIALDVATGAGHTALLLSQHANHVIGLDLTPNMMKVARQEADRLGRNNITWVLGDVESLPFLDDSFEVVTCRIAAHHFPCIEQAMREIHRVLAPKGIFILVDNYVSEDEETGELVNRIEKLRDPSHSRCLSLETWQILLETVEFEEVVCEHTWSTPIQLNDWFERAKTPAENRKQVMELLEGALPEQKEWMDYQPSKDPSISLRKGMWVCRKASFR
jgi:ubiquinone/menaquinone biosynthesis C-methylase UbiE